MGNSKPREFKQDLKLLEEVKIIEDFQKLMFTNVIASTAYRQCYVAGLERTCTLKAVALALAHALDVELAEKLKKLNDISP